MQYTTVPGVERHHVQDVQQLPLVLVDPLHLDVEEAARVDVDTGGLLEVLGELVLVVLLDLHHLVLEPRVLGELLQLGQLVQVRRPVLADLLAVNGKDMFKSCIRLVGDVSTIKEEAPTTFKTLLKLNAKRALTTCTWLVGAFSVICEN